MILEKTPGINILFPFYEYYTREYPLDMNEIFENPERNKFGYLWKDLSSEFIKQTSKYTNSKIIFTGFYLTSYEDAGICLSLFNRYIYLLLTSNFETYTKKTLSLKNIYNPDEDRDLTIWKLFHNDLVLIYQHFYIPFKKFLASKRPERCWISISQQKLGPKDPIYSDFLCDVPVIEAVPPGNFSHKFWEDVIKEGPFLNPEIYILQSFFDYFPGTAKYAPDKITEKVEIESYKDLKDFGLI